MIGSALALLGKINAQGAVAGSLAAVLLAGMVWQGCEHRAADRLTEAYKNERNICLMERASWEHSAAQWQEAAERCSAQTESLRQAALREQDILLRELRAARAARQVSELQLTELRRRVEAGEISVQELLKEVQGI